MMNMMTREMIEMAVRTDEDLTVAVYMTPDYFPWSVEDDEYEGAVAVENEVCGLLGRCPEDVDIVTGDNADNLDEFHKLYDELYGAPTVAEIGFYHVKEYAGMRFALSFGDGGLAVIYAPKMTR